MHGKPARRLMAVAGLVTLLVSGFASGAGAAARPARPHLTARTFESDPAGSVPPGCTTPSGALPATVTNACGYRSRQSLLVNDESTTAVAEIQCPAPAQTGAEFDFEIYPAQLRNGFLLTLLGNLSTYPGGPRPVFHLEVTPSGSITWYDNAGWTQIAPAGTVPMAAWSHLRLQVPTDQQEAYTYVNGRYVGQSGPWGVRAVADITGYDFSSAGTATAGDEVYVDNVVYGGPAGRAPVVPEQFRVGAPVTVAQSGTPVQMPNTAVAVRVDGRRQILADYPAHTDATDTSGNIMSVST